MASFLSYVSEKGLINRSTAQGWRVASTRVLDDLSPAEAADVRLIDVELTFKQFVNRNPGQLSPASLGEYRRRVGTALAEFVTWASDPAAYRPRFLAREARGETSARAERSRAPRSYDSAAGVTQRTPGFSTVNHEGLPLPFPIRPDFLAQVIVPRDLSMQEARRLGAFLLTLAVDFRPGEP
ncbi:MAG: hypothetical protein ABJD11_01325 [Gemmatimonadota bacterium]